MAKLDELFSNFDSKQSTYIQDMKDVISIPSMSVYPSKWPEIDKMINWFASRIKQLTSKCVTVELCDVGEWNTPDGKTHKCPQVLLATIGCDPTKKTLLVYGNVDVALAKQHEGWNTCPFQLSEVGGNLHGRGTSDNKGPLLCWLHVIEAYDSNKTCTPVNIKLIIEGMCENGSEGLEQLLTFKKAFMENIDFVCLTKSNWLSKKPCIVYGQRGICYFTVEVAGLEEDVCSKKYGGGIHEPIIDVLFLMDSIQDKENMKINIPGVMDDVLPPTAEEESAYKKVGLDVNELKSFIGARRLTHAEKDTRILMHCWRLPALVLHGIEGVEEGDKPVIPGKVIGKFSIQIVENQNPERVRQCVSTYLEQLWKKRGSPNSVKLRMNYSSPALVEDTKQPGYKAALKAVKRVYNTDAILIRQGGTVPAAAILKQLTSKCVVMLCIGEGTDQTLAPNEKLSVKNYMDGHKLIAAFIDELAQV